MVYIHKWCFIDSNKLDKHHKQYSKYGKKHSVVKLLKQLPFRNFFLCLQKKIHELVSKKGQLVSKKGKKYFLNW